MHTPENQLMTLLFPVHKDSILLGMKKTSLGKGWWNGFGGKVEQGESIEEAAVRELAEECGLLAKTEDLLFRGKIDFYFSHKPQWNQQVHMYLLEDFLETPKETLEMRPVWFKVANIPYDDMWPADTHFVPRILKGEILQGAIYFSPGGQKGELKSSTGETIVF